ncbi:hypothetical protein A1O7_00807 [Cladophialophora yegresii CBS 114405]|uniref:Zn(2)-C6 fungal-type domain-containing protein n=1 Tax=Cladophialophora yegresii CBS 114405 TaxID=1182544 RepID=W9WIN0_9EURO|nr:uncharacterized protein A1O7_00807 [Cladophialophora yegresii CBS 114405]EXJ64471.1 hypothetical protein A1O7_00807 [Cladophialophora yegresii CBS 114405]
MEPTKTNPIRRKRPFLSKTRTGCLTCKVRKVKCDEEKPACRRCTSTGRKCDGYAPAPASSSVSATRSKSLSVRSSSSSSSSNSTSPSRRASPRRPPSADLFASEAERRSFAYFETRACHDLSLGGSFHGQFWAREVLQAAVHYPSTRHLVVAIGAAFEAFQESAVVSSGSRESNAMRLSIEQCNRSIQLMGALFDAARSEAQSVETTCNILTASILFAYLACLQGQISQAIDHVRSGLKVLQDFEKARSLGHDDHEHDRPADIFPVSVSHLKSLLTSIYGQIRCMINDEALATWERDPLVSAIDPVLSFSTLADAHGYVENLWHNLLALLQYTELHPPRTADEVALFTAHHQLLSRSLDSSRDALEALASQRTPHAGSRDEHGLNILRLYQTLVAVRLRINPLEPGNREAAFDELEPELEQMLRYCELLVQDRSRGHGHGHGQQSDLRSSPSFSSGLGYVMPLHTIAARCRNPRIRRRALQLLLSSGRREGLWDAGLTGKIVTTTMEREERLRTEPVPSDGRVREVKIEFLGERRARLRYITVADWRARLYGEQHILEW